MRVPVEKSLELTVTRPEATRDDKIFAETIFTFPEVAARLRLIREIVEKYRSVLIFTNTRSEAEALANRFRVWDIKAPDRDTPQLALQGDQGGGRAGPQGGEALRRDMRPAASSSGSTSASWTTSSSTTRPRQVSRLIQRVGRSGHRIGQTSKGLIITQDSDDTLEAMVLCRRSLLGPAGAAACRSRTPATRPSTR